MAKENKYKWKSPSWLKDPVAAMAYFHDEVVEVYDGTTEISGIQLWRENYRINASRWILRNLWSC